MRCPLSFVGFVCLWGGASCLRCSQARLRAMNGRGSLVCSLVFVAHNVMLFSRCCCSQLFLVPSSCISQMQCWTSLLCWWMSVRRASRRCSSCQVCCVGGFAWGYARSALCILGAGGPPEGKVACAWRVAWGVPQPCLSGATNVAVRQQRAPHCRHCDLIDLGLLGSLSL